MRTVYEASTYINGVRKEHDFSNATDARTFVELGSSGKIITFVVRPNMPNRLPAEVYNSCGLDVFENGAWRDVNIHGGY